MGEMVKVEISHWSGIFTCILYNLPLISTIQVDPKSQNYISINGSIVILEIPESLPKLYTLVIAMNIIDYYYFTEGLNYKLMEMYYDSDNDGYNDQYIRWIIESVEKKDEAITELGPSVILEIKAYKEYPWWL